jgi:prevent-host-death family protein
MLTKTSAEAQNQFGQLLDTVQREPVAITRHGRPAAFIVSPRDMEVLMAMKASRKPGGSAFEEWTSKFSNQVSPEAAELTDEDVVRMVHEARLEAARDH